MGLRNCESDILRACLEWLHLRHVYAWRSNQGPIPLPDGGFRRFAGLKGVADILGILPRTVLLAGASEPITIGLFLAIEVKRPASPGVKAGQIRAAQREFLDAINSRGGLGLVVHGVDELVRLLEPYLEQ